MKSKRKKKTQKNTSRPFSKALYRKIYPYERNYGANAKCGTVELICIFYFVLYALNNIN